MEWSALHLARNGVAQYWTEATKLCSIRVLAVPLRSRSPSSPPLPLLRIPPLRPLPIRPRTRPPSNLLSNKRNNRRNNNKHSNNKPLPSTYKSTSSSKIKHNLRHKIISTELHALFRSRTFNSNTQLLILKKQDRRVIC